MSAESAGAGNAGVTTGTALAGVLADRTPGWLLCRCRCGTCQEFQGGLFRDLLNQSAGRVLRVC